ncbi:glycosyltransferase [Campylobacter sp. 2018MI35]|uniref:glycosyltransferase family 2 protein n=1 Tax=unclassified Campylobacter TaxID=2593542 RepID=UPI001903E6B7|nr:MULTISPECIES: glycosyltransferase family 2 protein [unclassified Campylobacter]MBK1971376.1 glycosyltransferase [Campylobacter sp. TTU_617]MBK1991017.1 glycosyltransferase [Campylobacter sp. 2018MI34]
MQPLVSIIIPIYNTKNYLEQCLKSVINQTYTHLDIILVDDGSDDGSLEIAQNYVKKDKRFFLISKKNGGLSSARNMGLEFIKQSPLRTYFQSNKKIKIKSYLNTNSFNYDQTIIKNEKINFLFTNTAQSRYIKTSLKNINELIIQRLPKRIIHFLDSDDYLEKDCIETCVKKMLELKLDIFIHSFKEFLEHKKTFITHPDTDILKNTKKNFYKNGLDLLKDNSLYLFYFAWQGSFKSEMLNSYKLRFTYGIYHEDHDFGTILFLNAKNIYYENIKLMVYRIRENSITQSQQDTKFPKKLPKNQEFLREYFNNYNDLRSYFKAHCLCVIAVNIFNFICQNQKYKKDRFLIKACSYYTDFYMLEFYPLSYLHTKELLQKLNLRLRFKIMFRLFKKDFKLKLLRFKSCIDFKKINTR